MRGGRREGLGSRVDGGSHVGRAGEREWKLVWGGASLGCARDLGKGEGPMVTMGVILAETPSSGGFGS